jgi:hypothetical protein
MLDRKPPVPAAKTPSDRLIIVGLVAGMTLLVAASVMYLV